MPVSDLEKDRFAFACILLGLGGSFLGGFSLLLIASGALVVSGLNAPAKALAKNLYDGFGGKPPFVSYSFFPDSFTYAPDSEPVPYSSVIRLVDDGEYLYLYVSKKTAYMVTDSSVNGDNGLAGLKAMLSRACGQTWKTPKKFSLFSGIYDSGEGLFSSFTNLFKKR